MDLITTTELRTKTPKVVSSLAKGLDLTLIHRSRAIGTIKSQPQDDVKPVKAALLAAALKKFEPKKEISYKELMKRYEQYIMYRHGPSIS